MVKAKLFAAMAHGAFTGIIALLTAFLVYGVWYPGAFAEMLGGTGLYRLVVGVEVILGPLMSLVIYNTTKSRAELFRDYAVIIVVQILAFGFGVYSVAQSRPVYLVFVKDRIEVVAATELQQADLLLASEEFDSVGWLGPRLICTESPVDPIEKSDLLMSALKGKDIQLQPRYYRDCLEGEIWEEGYRRSDLSKLTDIPVEALPSQLSRVSFRWLPVVSRFGAWTAFFEESTVNTPTYLNYNPFQRE